jgi:cob(I)alamin adenosyltransferase
VVFLVLNQVARCRKTPRPDCEVTEIELRAIFKWPPVFHCLEAASVGTADDEGVGARMVQYYYGRGCGKTSIALGRVVRALGAGLSPMVIQFLKLHQSDPGAGTGYFYSEYEQLLRLNVPVHQFGTHQFALPGSEDPELQINTQHGVEFARDALSSGAFDLVVLDEFATATALGFIPVPEALSTLQGRAAATEVIITGRERIEEFVALADFVTELVEVKHAYQRGVQARPGYEH